jgi:uncharacterized protein (TIGR00369 family)
MSKNNKDQELFNRIKDIFNEKIPFNKVLGLKVESIEYNQVSITFNMRDQLIGNYLRGTLHGGVISSVIDVTGGLSAFMGIQQKSRVDNLESKIDMFKKLGTIDLRIDYLRPGLGSKFIATGYTLRTGNKIAVTRIEIKNESNELIAVGTGSYVVA